MKKKTIKRRLSRLWEATSVYEYLWADDETYLAKIGKPIKGSKMRRLLSGVAWDAVNHW